MPVMIENPIVDMPVIGDVVQEAIFTGNDCDVCGEFEPVLRLYGRTNVCGRCAREEGIEVL